MCDERLFYNEWLQQEMLCHRQWTDEYIESSETLTKLATVI